MHLTIRAIAAIAFVTSNSLASMSSSTISSLDYQSVSLILTAIYVGLTLVLAVGTIWSVYITRASLKLAREQMEINKKQSQDASEASAKQSRDAIEAVHDQIKASERQTRDAMHNQHRPVIVPVDEPITPNMTSFTMRISNAGAGVALNAWGILAVKDLEKIFSFDHISFFVPILERDAQVSFKEGEIQYRFNAFEEYPLFPRDENNTSYDFRLMITYDDVFKNKYLVIFDHNRELGWKQVELKKIERRLDELTVRRTSLDQWLQQVSKES